jgi:hypothetical protein
LARHICHPAVAVRHLHSPEWYHIINMNMATCPSRSMFYYRIMANLRRFFGEVQPNMLWKPSRPNETNICDLETLLCRFPNYRLVLVLDNFEQRNPEQFGHQFLLDLQSLMRVSEYQVAMVMVVRPNALLRPTWLEMLQPELVCLGGLETAVANQFLSYTAMGLGVPLGADAQTAVRQLAGGIPYVLKLTVLYWLTHQIPDPQNPPASLLGKLAPLYSSWYAQLTPAQQQCLLQWSQQTPGCLVESNEMLGMLGLAYAPGHTLHHAGDLFFHWLRQEREPHLMLGSYSATYPAL